MSKQEGSRRPEARFRRWLIQRLKASRWTERGIEGDIDTVARRLGVQPDVLIEAQRSLDAEQAALGRVGTTLGTGRARSHRALGDGRLERNVFAFDVPVPVYRDLDAYCKLRALSVFTVIRSLIVHLLSRQEQPGRLDRYWFYRGGKYTPKKHGRRAVGTEITAGANEALTRRARVTGVTVVALVRGMVIDLLEGRIKTLRIVSNLQQMPDDARQYVTLDERS